jgi:hypothetical protein
MTTVVNAAGKTMVRYHKTGSSVDDAVELQ